MKPYYIRDAQRRDKKRLIVTVIICIAAAVFGVVLFFVASAYAYEQRGRLAYGGEMFILAIPLYAVYKIVRTIANHINDRKEEPSC